MKIIGSIVIILASIWLLGSVVALLAGRLGLVGVLINGLLGWGGLALGNRMRKS